MISDFLYRKTIVDIQMSAKYQHACRQIHIKISIFHRLCDKQRGGAASILCFSEWIFHMIGIQETITGRCAQAWRKAMCCTKEAVL